MNVSHNIKQLRQLKDMSQKQVALALGMDQPQYSRIESGKVEPTLSSLQKIADVFDVSLSELLREKMDINQEINVPLLEKIKLIDELEEDEKEALLKMIDIAISRKRMKDNLSTMLAS